jgi:hypothetical protein
VKQIGIFRLARASPFSFPFGGVCEIIEIYCPFVHLRIMGY